MIDNGIGIPAEHDEAHVRAVPFSTKGNRGTGLGLAVARKIVEEHDGVINVRSKPGEGTTFIVKLPIYAGSLADPSQTHGPAK